MAQIKVLDLCNSDSLSELSYEIAEKVNGGLLGGAYGAGRAIRRGSGYRRLIGAGAARGGIRFGVYGVRSGIGSLSPYALPAFSGLGASLSTPN